MGDQRLASVSTERTVLSAADLHALAKIAAVVHDNGLLDEHGTSPQVLDLCRRCSDAVARGEVLALAHTEKSLLTALADRAPMTRWWLSEWGRVAHLLTEGIPGTSDYRSPWTACSTGFVGTVRPAPEDTPRCRKCVTRSGENIGSRSEHP